MAGEFSQFYETIRKGELAKLAGVAPPAITYAKRTILRPALTPDGKKFYRDHPAVQAYVRRSHVSMRQQERDNRNRKNPAPMVRTSPSTNGNAPKFADPFALCKPPEVGVSPAGPGVPPHPGLRASPPVQAGLTSRSELSAPARQMLYDLHFRTNGALPADLDDLGAMTLREVADQFGSLKELHDAVKSQKDFAAMQQQQVKTEKLRGELIPREIVADVLFPFINLLCERMIKEVPRALASQIVARVMSGGDDLQIDVEAMIRNENSSVAKSCRDGFAKAVKKHCPS